MHSADLAELTDTELFERLQSTNMLLVGRPLSTEERHRILIDHLYPVQDEVRRRYPPATSTR